MNASTPRVRSYIHTMFMYILDRGNTVVRSFLILVSAQFGQTCQRISSSYMYRSFSTHRAVQDLVDSAFDELFFVPVCGCTAL